MTQNFSRLVPKSLLFNPGPLFSSGPLQKSQTDGNLAVVGWARARDGTGWRLVLSFADRDGRNHEVLLKRSDILAGDALFVLLDDHGYAVPADHRGRAALRAAIIGADPKQRLLIGHGGKLVPDANGEDTVRLAVTKIIDSLPRLAKRALDLTKRKRPVDPKAAMSASVLRVRHADGRRLLALRPDTFKKLIGGAVSEKAVMAVLDVLEQRGVLVPRGNGRRTRELRLPGGNARRTYYCLRLPKRD